MEEKTCTACKWNNSAYCVLWNGDLSIEKSQYACGCWEFPETEWKIIDFEKINEDRLNLFFN